MQLTRTVAPRLARTAVSGLLVVAALLVAGCTDNDYYYPPYDVPNSVAIIDMNGDGVDDIVYAATHFDSSYPNPGFAGVIVQNAAAPGTFAMANSVAVGANPSILAVGNLDDVSGPDVVVANANSGNISTLLHDASLTNPLLQAARNTTVGGVPYDVAVGDLNNDGLPDVAVADAGSSLTVVILLRDPGSPGNYLAPTTLSVPNPATSVAIADINGDGRNDLVATVEAGNGAGQVSVFLQSAVTAGSFPVRADYAAGTQPIGVKIADLDNDGRPDLALANSGPGSGSGTSGVSVLIQSAAAPGTFLAPVTYATARGSVAVAIGDLNNDGFRDLAVANVGGSSTGTISVLLQDATRPGNFLTPVNYRGVCEPLGIAIGNLNGDAFLDIAVADGDRATVMMNMAAAPGTFAAAVPVG